MNENIISFSFNKCIAEIYTLLNFLEKNKIFTGKLDISKDILACLFPIVPSLVESILKDIYPKETVKLNWPSVNKSEIEETEINLPIQINGRFICTYKIEKDYLENNVLEKVKEIPKFKNRIKNSQIKKIIHVQNKILNIII